MKLIVDKSGPLGLWTGFRLHFVRDTMGTALYFAEYDVMRHWLGRKGGGGMSGVSGEQGELPDWARGWLPVQLVPFLCGSLAGVTSWALIYPVDVSATERAKRSEVARAAAPPHSSASLELEPRAGLLVSPARIAA